MTTATERDPDEIRLTKPAAPKQTEAELEKIFDDDFEHFDFSLEASIRAQLSAWRLVAELRGAVIASPPSEGRAHALEMIEAMDRWFEGQDERYSAMLELARRGAAS